MLRTVDLLASMTVDLPDAEMDGLRVERFTIGANDPRHIREALLGRATAPGAYTRLMLDGRLWMSDTDAEKRDHLPALRAIEQTRARRVLVNGLGLGMIVKGALAFDHVERVDVVEIDPRVAKLIGTHYTYDDPRVVVYVADAYEQARRWPAGSTWDVAWSDIWPSLCTDNLDDMARLRRSYARRTTWHECWGRELLLRHRAADRRRGW